MWSGAINTITPEAFSFRVPAEKWDRRLFLGIVVDDCADWRLFSDLYFYNKDSLRLKIPVNVWYNGVGLDYIAGEQDVALPVWSTRRTQIGYQSINQDNWAMNERPVIEGALQTSWTYYDGTNYWNYNVVMAPFPIRGSFDRIEWQPNTFSGTLATDSTLLGVYVGMLSL